MNDEKPKKSIARRLGSKALRGTWAVTKLTGPASAKGIVWSSRKVWDKRPEISGAVLGAAEAGFSATVDTTSHIAFQKRVERKRAQLRAIADRQKVLEERFRNRVLIPGALAKTVLDTVAIGGETLATHLRRGEIPDEIQRAYEGAYPNLAAEIGFLDRVKDLEGMALIGFVSGVKGKLFELQYVDYLNQGALPDGYQAFISDNPINPGWDIGILGPDGELKDLIQLKATESVGYVRQALERYPHIDVVTTSEVHAQLLAQGMADNVIDGGIPLADVHADVYGAISVGDVAMDWTPPLVAIALIAFTSYSRKSMTAFDRSREFGERGTQAYLAYLAGGAVAIASGTVWLGLLGAVGSKLVLVSGRKKSERLNELNDLIRQNQRAQNRLESQMRERRYWSRWVPGL